MKFLNSVNERQTGELILALVCFAIAMIAFWFM
jgi:hypothetical protein